MIFLIPVEPVGLDKGYYHGFYVLLQFDKQSGFYRKQAQADMEADPDEQQMNYMRLNYEGEHNYRMSFN